MATKPVSNSVGEGKVLFIDNSSGVYHYFISGEPPMPFSRGTSYIERVNLEAHSRMEQVHLIVQRACHMFDHSKYGEDYF